MNKLNYSDFAGLSESSSIKVLNGSFLQTIKERLKDTMPHRTLDLKNNLNNNIKNEAVPTQPRKIIKIDMETVKHFSEISYQKNTDQRPQLGVVVMKGQKLTKKDFKAVYDGKMLNKNKKFG